MRRVGHGWLLLLMATPALAGTATLRWPDASPGGACAGLSLQQCIDVAPAGAVLRVVRGSGANPYHHAIPGTLTLSRPLILRVDSGVDAVLAEGANIECRPVPDGPGDCHVEGFVLRRGRILLDTVNARPGFVRLVRNRIGIPPRSAGEAAIQVSVGASVLGPGWEVDISHNVLTSTGALGATGIGVDNADDSLVDMRATISDNIIESAHPQGMRSGISAVRRRGAEWRVERNIVRGSTGTADSSPGISLSVFPGSNEPLRVADNWIHTPEAAAAGIQLYPGTASPRLRILNNSLSAGAYGIAVSAGSPAIRVELYNNLIVGQRSVGILIEGGAVPVVEDGQNAFYGNGLNAMGFVPSAANLFTDPRIEATDFPRPRAGSPLVGAGNTPQWLDGAPGVEVDVAGDSRREGVIDIGAMEWNRQLVFQHTASADNLSFHYTTLPPSIGDTDWPVTTPLRPDSSPAELDQVLGFWNPEPGRLAIFHENPAQAMSPGRRFVVARFADQFPGGFAHDAATVEFACSPVAGLDGRAVAIANHRYEAPSGFQYYPAPLSFLYDFRTPGRWLLCDERNQPPPTGLRFHVASGAVDSPNAWTTPSLEQAADRVPLAHRLLDGSACALPVVGRGHDLSQPTTPLNPVPLALDHDPPSGPGAPSRWVVHAVGSTPRTFPYNVSSGGAAFHAMLSGAQALRCRADADLLRDGFE